MIDAIFIIKCNITKYEVALQVLETKGKKKKQEKMQFNLRVISHKLKKFGFIIHTLAFFMFIIEIFPFPKNINTTRVSIFRNAKSITN